MNEFDAIFQEKSPLVYRYLLSLCGDPALADELTSETFFQAYLHIGKFRADCKLETWLCQIAKNALFKEYRRRKKTPPSLSPDDADEHKMFEALSDREQALEIHKHLHLLREPYREVFMLRIFGELSFKDIARIFQKNESWAKVTYYRAKNKLIEEMKQK